MDAPNQSDSSNSRIAADLDDMLAEIGRINRSDPDNTPPSLARIAALLQGFLSRYAEFFTFGNFPLPVDPAMVSCSYQLTADGQNPTLLVNTMRGGVNSIVHDHGTWAVIAAVIGSEVNRIYRHVEAPADPGATSMVLDREVMVRPGEPLVLEEGLFHSIHTPSDAPALQLHLYGAAVDEIPGRQAFDPDTGRSVYLSA